MKILTKNQALDLAIKLYVKGGGNEKTGLNLLDADIKRFSEKNLAYALVYNGFSKPGLADRMAAAFCKI